ncbi:hypothetical protein [Acidianus sp. RZ1]|uniref:hypothetical protein n=1 Tax=Acidianus sp. RZ1 TaxID=1540082 RepID=UPI0014921CD1|nr:hypothetical protein [Acidianus sp. RZ1]NON62243.1 hypothetical protein [Acidianus sp. RZ1]
MDVKVDSLVEGSVGEYIIGLNPPEQLGFYVVGWTSLDIDRIDIVGGRERVKDSD